MNNIKIGLVIATYESAENLERSLEPWLAIKNDYNVILSAFHAVFEEHHQNGKPILSVDGTVDILKTLKNDKKLDYLNISDTPLSEAAARTLAIEPLLKDVVDYVWILDAQDEIYTTDQIKNIINYIIKYPDVAVFKICFQNHVIRENTVLKDAFIPNRIWKVKSLPFILDKFSWDNDCFYKRGEEIISDKFLKTKTIPQNLVFVKHLSWVGSKERLIDKINYQNLHFGERVGGFGCGYKWNYGENKLEFNPNYFASVKQPIPETKTLESCIEN